MSEVKKSNFEPKIIVFACNWCTYTGCDQAGRSRMQRPPNVRIIRHMCSGRIDPLNILYALKNGADGVIIGACHLGDCHYVSGNFKKVRRAALLKTYIEQLGYNPKRLQMWHISASEGAEFTEKIKEYINELKEIGPNPSKKILK